MPENSQRRGGSRASKNCQAGGAAVEFALVAIIFFMFVLGVIEVARAMYVVNTLQEVTRRAARAAANTDFRDAAALDRVRQDAIFQSAPGTLLLAAPISDEYIRFDYFSIRRGLEGVQTFVAISESNLPASPAENRLICLRDPNDAQCIRLVQARVCEPGEGECVAAPFRSFIPLVDLSFPVHTAPSLVVAETLGQTSVAAKVR